VIDVFREDATVLVEELVSVVDERLAIGGRCAFCGGCDIG